MRARRIGLGVFFVALLAAPFTTACYRERIQACRDPITDFSSFSSVAIVRPSTPFGGAEQALPTVSYTISASTTLVGQSNRCVGVHSELLDSAGRSIEVIDTPIRASITGGVLTTTSMFHYHSGSFPLTLRVSALGQTVEATVLVPSRFPDAGVRGDAGSSDAGARDAAFDDAGLDDAGSDAGP